MKNELLKNTLIVGSGRVLAQFSALLLIPVYTIFLRPDEYGAGDLIITYAALLLPLVTLALEQGAFRLLVDARENDLQKTHVISFLVKVSTTLFVVAAALALAAGFVYGSDLMGLAVLYTAGSISINVCLWLARGLGDTMGYAKGSILVGVSTLVLTLIAVVWLKLGLVGMIGSLAAANFVGAAYYTVRLKLYRYTKVYAHNKKIAKELLAYSLPLVPNGISWWLINAADRTIIAISLGVAATGVFAISAKFPAILVALFSIFWVSWHESASLHIKKKDRDEFFSKVANTNILLFGTLGLLILVGVSIAFPVIIGQEFRDAYMYIPILMVGAVLYTMATLYGSVYAAAMKTKHILSTTLMAGVASILTTLLLIHSIGLFAPASASVVGYLVMTIYRHYDIRKYVVINIRWRKMSLFMLCAVLSVVMYYIDTMWLNVVNLLFVCSIGIIFNKGIILSTKDLVWAKLSKS